MSRQLWIDDRVYELDWLLSSFDGQSLLAKAHQGKQRLRCACTPNGVEVYVSCRGPRFYVARMPGSGAVHAATCESGEDTNFLTGSPLYAPDVIVEQDDGSLVVIYGRPAITGIPIASMGIAGLIDLLLEQANLNRHHYRAGQDKLTWATTKHRLSGAAKTIFSKDARRCLDDQLVIPDTYSREESSQSQDALVQRIVNTNNALVCAPLKEIRRTAYGWMLVLKHLPGLRFWLSQTVANEAERNSSCLWSLTTPPRYALCIAEIKPAREQGSYTVLAMAMRQTDSAFMPCASDAESEAANRMRGEGESFLRPLRFDAPDDTPLADYALLDPDMTPVFIKSSTTNPVIDASRHSLAMLLQRHNVPIRTIAPQCNQE